MTDALHQILAALMSQEVVLNTEASSVKAMHVSQEVIINTEASFPIDCLSPDGLLQIFDVFDNFKNLHKFAAANKSFYSIFTRYENQIRRNVMQNILRENLKNARTIILYQRVVGVRLPAREQLPYVLDKQALEVSFKEKFTLKEGELKRLMFNHTTFKRCVAQDWCSTAYEAIDITEYYRLAVIALKSSYDTEFNRRFDAAPRPLSYGKAQTVSNFARLVLDIKFWRETNMHQLNNLRYFVKRVRGISAGRYSEIRVAH